MKFYETELQGAYVIELEKLQDERGYFARAWCQREFSEHGLDTALVQCNLSLSLKKGTLRGMHYQDPPYAENKLVRCIRGALYDIIVDLRPDSPTFLRSTAAELTWDNGKMMYVPKGFAHGFVTMEDNTMAFYQVSAPYARDYCRGVRWNDPQLNLKWPLEVSVVSAQDKAWGDLSGANLSPLKGLIPHRG